MPEIEDIHIREQLDLLWAIEARPGMYIRQTSIGNINGLRDIENIMFGYEMRGDSQSETQFSTEFTHYLRWRFPKVIAVAGFVEMVDEIALFDEPFQEQTVWSLFWKLLHEFKNNLELKRGK